MYAAHALLTACALAAGASAASCSTQSIPVTATAQNRVLFAPTYDLNSLSGITSFISSGGGFLGQLAGFIPTSGTYTIAATYCEPDSNANAPASRKDEVQLLLHGVPYNRTYWFGDGYPGGSEEYNWVDYATSQGYPVLAIDNLGAGDSEKPDPVLVVQQPLQTEILHAIAQMLRAGHLSFAPKASKVIYVGHSLASVMGNGIASKYPADFDALVLTGYTYTLAEAALGLLLTFLEPASIQNPARHGTLDPGYLTFGSATGKRNSYYAQDGSFDPALAAFDFAHEDLFSIGQLYSAFTGLERADAFTGDVLAVTGDQDALFCGDGSRALGPQSCGAGNTSVLAKTQSFWPNANYQYYEAPSTSHATTLHYSAPGSIKAAHAFLAANGY